MPPRVALVVCWFGPWRPWINLFVHSCALNSRFDFLVFTDQPPPEAGAANVRFLPLTMAALEARAQTALGFPVRLRAPYKVCDLKPTYGLVLADVLRDYSHWGWCDEDIFFGRLEQFITDEVLEAYDVVTSCRCSVVGQLTILRNSDYHNRLVLRAPKVAEILAHPGIHLLDEDVFDGIVEREAARTGLKVLRRQIQVHDVHDEVWSAWANRLELAETGRVLGPLKHGPATWRHGRVVHDASGEEFAFYHFRMWKHRWPLPRRIPMPPVEVEGWAIGENGITFFVPPRPAWRTHWFLARYRLGCAAARGRRPFVEGWQRAKRVARCAGAAAWRAGGLRSATP